MSWTCVTGIVLQSSVTMICAELIIYILFVKTWPKLRAARPSRIAGQGYSQASTFWCVLNVSLDMDWILLINCGKSLDGIVRLYYVSGWMLR